MKRSFCCWPSLFYPVQRRPPGLPACICGVRRDSSGDSRPIFRMKMRSRESAALSGQDREATAPDRRLRGFGRFPGLEAAVGRQLSRASGRVRHPPTVRICIPAQANFRGRDGRTAGIGPSRFAHGRATSF